MSIAWRRKAKRPSGNRASDLARNLNGPYGTFFYHPGVFFGDDSGSPTDAFPSFADTPTLQYRYLAPANSLVVETLEGSLLSSFKVPNQVLDRSIFDYRKRKIDGEIAKASEVIRDTMQCAARLSVPLVVEIGTGTTWAEAH